MKYGEPLILTEDEKALLLEVIAEKERELRNRPDGSIIVRSIDPREDFEAFLPRLVELRAKKAAQQAADTTV